MSLTNRITENYTSVASGYMRNSKRLLVGTAAALLLTLGITACAPASTAISGTTPEPEFVMTYQQGNTQVNVYGAGKRSAYNGVHERQILRYQTGVVIGEDKIEGSVPDNIEVVCETFGKVYDGQTESGAQKTKLVLNLPVRVMINGKTAMTREWVPHRKVYTTSTAWDYEGGYFYHPESQGANNAYSLDEVAQRVCEEADSEVTALNKANAQKAAVEKEEQIAQNTEAVRPR